MSDPNQNPEPETPATPSEPATSETAAPETSVSSASHDAAADAPTGDPGAGETSPNEASAAEAPHTEPASDDGGGAAPDASGDDAAAASDDAAAASDDDGGDGKKKKKRRRRRKKKKKGDLDPEKAAAHVPFLSYFESRGGKGHAFAAGEVVAGRVSQVTDTTIFVDLFGKATAVADIFEPREVPPLPEPVQAGQAVEAAPAAPAEAVEPAAAPTEGDEVAATTEATAPAEGAEVPAIEAPAESAAKTESQDAAPESAPAATEAPSEVTEAAPEAPAVTEVADAAPAAASEGAETAAHDEEHEHDHDEVAVEFEDDGDDDSDHGIDLSDARFLASTTDLGEPPEPPEVGGIFRGRVASVAESGHIILVNRIIDRPGAKAEIAAARDKKLRVRGLVYGFNRGGFDVLVNGIRAFCPARAMALSAIDDPESYVGQKLEFALPPVKGGGRSIIVSRRGILEREARRAARERMKKLKVGERMPGVVQEVRDYGVIVDIGGGVDGLVHQSEVSWQRGVRMSDVVKPGDPVEVEVLKVQPASRKDRYGKLSLSIRRCQPDPWDTAKETLVPGHFQKGRVVRTAEFGAFVELVPGVEGLLHISELGGKDLKHANQVLKEDEEIDVLIERVDHKARRIGLSRLSEADKAAIESGEFDPEQARKLKQGAHITVVVDRIEHHGIFVRVKGVVGKRGRGYISNRDLGEREDGGRIKISQGDELEVKITGTDRDGGLRCSVKHRKFDEERKAVRDYRKEANRQGLGTFGDLLRAKLEGGDDK